MKHFDLDNTLDRIKTFQDRQELKEKLIANTILAADETISNSTKPVVTVAPSADTTVDTNTTDNDDSEDNNSDDSAEDSEDDDSDATKTFPSTPATEDLYNKLQAFGDQSYVLAELLNQIEGFKGENNTDSMNSAISAMKNALSDTAKQQDDIKSGLIKYLSQFKQ